MDDALAQAFDALVAELVVPMVVVTAAASDGERSGCLVGFHGQCGIEPRRYAVWLSTVNRTYRVGLRSGYLAVHLLGRDDVATAVLFGGETGDEVDKFSRCAWTPGPGGVPLLDACPNRMVGRRTAVAEVGSDHVAMVLAPVRVDHVGLAHPLLLAEVADLDLDPGHPAEER